MVIVLTTAVSLTAGSAAAVDERSETKGSALPKRAEGFLELLRAAAPASVGFDIRRSKVLDADALLEFVSSEGLKFSDVNGRAAGQAGRARIRKEVQIRRGRFFKALMHLGYIYGQPRKHFPIRQERIPAGLKVSIGWWYVVTFREEGGQLHAAEIDYREEENE